MTPKLVPFLARIGLICGLMLPAAGWACSPAAGYRVPTNFELVQQADLIVIAQVDWGPEGSIASRAPSDLVRIAPMQVLKGVLPKDPLDIPGMVSSADGKAFESAPTPLTTSHFSTRLGACTRRDYAKGSLVLAMFEKTGDGLRPIAAPFARAIEDIESYDSLWVRTARRYVGIQQRARGDDLREAVIAERDKLRAQGSDMEAQAVADDLDRWLERASGAWPKATGWRYDDDLDEVSIVANGAAEADTASLSCRRNGTAIALTGSTKPKGLALTIGGRSFAAENGRISFTPELRRLLQQSAGPFAVAVDGRPIYQGRASDIFHKFALRCETLLEP